MIVREELWADIPLLNIYTEKMNETTPTVIFLHGHMSAKEHNLHYAYQLIQKGVRVILPDAIYHGSRTQQLSETELNIKFWEIVMQSVKEVGILYREGINNKVFLENNVALGGTSMGGITTSACLTQYEWIKTAAICMGVTSLSKLAEHQLNTITVNGAPIPLSEEQKIATFNYLKTFDIENHLEIFNDKPVIFWHGMKDDIVPFEFSYNYFEQNLQKSLAVFLKEEKAAHAVSRKGILEVTAFLAQNLSR